MVVVASLHRHEVVPAQALLPGTRAQDSGQHLEDKSHNDFMDLVLNGHFWYLALQTLYPSAGFCFQWETKQCKHPVV